MQFMGKFTFRSTNTEGPRKYLTSMTSAGLTVPIVAADMVTENERCLLYQPSDGTDGELIMQMGVLDYLSAVESIGFVIGDQCIEKSYRFKFASSGPVGGPVGMQTCLPDQKQWAPIRYTVNNLLPYLTFPIPRGTVRADPSTLLTTFTQTQITPSLATIQSSKCAQKCDL